MVPTMGPGAPLLPTETAKIDSRHEEVSFEIGKSFEKLIIDGTYIELIGLNPGNEVNFCHNSRGFCRITLDVVIVRCNNQCMEMKF